MRRESLGELDYAWAERPSICYLTECGVMEAGLRLPRVQNTLDVKWTGGMLACVRKTWDVWMLHVTKRPNCEEKS